MTAFAINKVDELGTGNITFEAITSGTEADSFANTGKEFIILKGHSSVTATVNFIAQITNVRHPSFGNTSKSNIVITLGAEQIILVGPFKPGAFNDSDNKVKMTTTMASGTSSPTAAVCYLDDR